MKLKSDGLGKIWDESGFLIASCDCIARTREQAAIDAKTIASRVSVHDELVAALQALANIPDVFVSHRKDNDPLMGWDDHLITAGDVRRARAALERAKQ